MSAVLLDPPAPDTSKPGTNLDKSFAFHKQPAWSVRRGGRELLIMPQANGKYRELYKVKGGATADTPPSQASQMQSALNQYLAVAATKPYSIQGTLNSGTSGGSSANFSFVQPIPIIPAMCVAIDYEVSIVVTLTLQATTGAATLSPFAPYSVIANQLTLGGAPPWNMTEFTPWHIDETMHRIDWDPAYQGLGAQAVGAASATVWPNPPFSTVLDVGPTPNQIGGSGSLSPGATVTNTTSVATNTNYTFTFRVRQILQRKRHLLVGAVPFGDPENRPNNVVQLYPLVGNLPEQNLFINGTGATATLHANSTINAIYQLKYIDLLPPGMQAPTPTVAFGLQLITSSPSGMSAGSLFPITHRTAMIYNAIHHILVNSQLPIESNYFGLWDDQDQQSARWAYDSTLNTFQNYFTQYHYNYRRYPYTGVYTAELDDGLFPEVPSVTPYQARMSPDKSYAGAWGIPVTPAMTTTLRIPSATSLSSPYIRNYEYGLVKVPY